MKRVARNLIGLALAAGALGVLPSVARAQSQPDLDHINVTYHGGALIQNVKVFTVFWGPDWKQSSLHDYFNNFLQALFADGRYLANLSQYSQGGYTIGNGAFIGTAIASAAPPAVVSDQQVRELIDAGIRKGVLPAPDADTLYYVAVPGSVLMTDPSGDRSDQAGFDAYHFYNPDGGYAYAVTNQPEPHHLTKAASHELAEAVTDEQPGGQPGWVDDNLGEIGDIPNDLYGAGRITMDQWLDLLTGSDGTNYTVQQVWSNRDNAPVAFAKAGGGPSFGFQ